VVVNAFDIYDIFADLVPGTVVVILLLGVTVPVDQTSSILNGVSGVGPGVILISISYVFGRIVRNMPYITNILLGLCHKPVSFESYVEDFIFSSDNPLEDSVKNNFLKTIYSKAEIAGSLGSSDTETILDIGYSELWGENTLYQRYTIVSGFYEGLSNSFILIIIFYLSTGFVAYFSIFSGYFYSTIWTSFVAESANGAGIFIVGLVVVYILIVIQFRKFEKRRATQFVIEIANRAN
jgi:hypothetical protein